MNCFVKSIAAGFGLAMMALPVAAQSIHLASRLPEAGTNFRICEKFQFDGDAYFTTFSATNGTCLYRIGADGTVNFVYRWTAPLSTGSYLAMAPVSYKSRFWFPQFEPRSGVEIWSSDGSSTGTYKLADLRPGGDDGVAAGPYGFQKYNGELYFRAVGFFDFFGSLGKTNGTVSGTTGVYRMPNSTKYVVGVSRLVPGLQGELGFLGGDTTTDAALFLSDGTQNGTEKTVQDFKGAIPACWQGRIFMSSRISDSIHVSDGRSESLLMTGAGITADHYSGDDKAFYFFSGRTFYRTKGIAGDVQPLLTESDKQSYWTPAYGNAVFGNGRIHSYANFQGDVFFTADSSLYRYSNSTSTLTQVKGFQKTGYDHSQPPCPHSLTEFAGKLYLKVIEGDRIELYRTDGTAGGTQKIDAGTTTYSTDGYELTTTPTISDPMLVSGNALYYTAVYEDSVGVALYRLESPTSVQSRSLNASAFHIYPNPSNGIVNLKLEGTAQFQNAQVADASGKLVHTHAMDGTAAATMNLSKLPAGIYTITVETDKGSSSQRLVIRK